MSDINPEYYRKGGIETYDFIKAKGLGFEAGNVVKYLTRYQDKGGLKDLRKAAWYLERLIVEAMVTEGEFAEPAANVKLEPAVNDRKRQAREDLLDSLASFHQGDIFPTALDNPSVRELLDSLAQRDTKGCKCRPDGRAQWIACPVHHLGRRYNNLAAGVDQAGVHEGDD